MTIYEAISAARRAIDEAARAAGRTDRVALELAAKTRTPGECYEAAACLARLGGPVLVGHNRVQEARATAERLAMPCVRAATAGTHPAFIASLADILLERAAVARGEEVAPASTTGTGPFHTVCPESCCWPAASGHSARPRRPR